LREGRKSANIHLTSGVIWGIPDNEIADESESGTPHDLSGQPAGNKTNHQYNQKTFVGNVHVTASATFRPSFAE